MRGPTLSAISAAALLLGTAGCTEIIQALAPQSEAIERWRAHDPASERVVDHSTFSEFLKTFTLLKDGIRRVDYAAAQHSRSGLDAYVGSLAAIDPRRLNRDEQLAYWINLYNAETIRVVLDHYPVKSIKDIDLEGSGLFGGPWNAPRVRVADRALTLNDIEHGILRPLWRDPRIHYAVNCASLGCPNLAARPYTGDTAKNMLSERARDFINHPRGVRIRNRELRLSSIYQWYQADFGENEEEVIEHIRRHADPELSAALEDFDSVDAYDYDWRLNDPEASYP